MRVLYRTLQLLGAIAGFGLLLPPAWPQASTGTVRGTVVDVSRAVIPGAQVTLTNTATNISFRTVTNTAGSYSFPGVNPGPYRLAAESSGMDKFEVLLTVQVQQTAVIDITLKVGQTATEITVADATPLVTADRPSLGHVLERRRIEQLPMNGRAFTQLLNTVPGVYGLWGRAFGMRAGVSDTVVDGSSHRDAVNGHWRGWVGLDAVQEFKVETNNSSARYTRPVSMVISTRSGTNEIHGTLFEVHRNNSFGTARARQDFWTKAPPLIRNEYGASAGGPVFLPRLYDGRNRTFWFFAYEGSRRVAPVTRGQRVPTEAMRNGDFSGLIDVQGRLLRLYDPWTTDSATWARQPFAHGGRLNVIPPSRISPLAKQVFELTPLPTHPEVNPLVDVNYWVSAPGWDRNYTTTSRIDHQFSPKDRFFARFTNWMTSSRVIGGQAADLSFVLDCCHAWATYDNDNLALSYTRVFSPTLFNELLVSGVKLRNPNGQGSLEDWAGRFGLPNPFARSLWPALLSLGLSDYSFASGNTRILTTGTFSADDNVTWVLGKHELNFGARYRYDQYSWLPNTVNTAGTHSFNTLATALYDPSTPRNNPSAVPQTGYDTANFFLGVANYSAVLRRNVVYPRTHELAFYLQDDWKVTPQLTLNLGLRWEYWSEYREKSRQFTSFDPAQRAVVLGASLDTIYRLGYTFPSIVEQYESLGARHIDFEQAGMRPSLADPNWKNFGPRLGVAYRLGQGSRPLVLRAGFRTSYAKLPHFWIEQTGVNPPLYATFRTTVTDAVDSPDGIRFYGLRATPQVVAGLNSRDVLRTDRPVGLTRGSYGVTYLNRHQPDVTIHDWNLTVEGEILPDTVARAAYVGNHGANFPQYCSFNDIPNDYVWFTTTGLPKPTGAFANVAQRPYDQQVYGNLRELRRTGWSNYNGIQLELERRYSRGFAYQIFYNLSNALATGDQANPNASTTVPELNSFLPGRVPEDYAARNRLLNYQRDTSVPKHRVLWNWLADLPFGRGKPLGGSVGRNLDRLIGGWQLAGRGSLNSNYFALPTGIFPNGNGVEIYGYKHPIEDCRGGGPCRPGYLYWNGYIPANLINSYDANGRPNGVMGVPSNYRPAGQPLLPWPQSPDRSDPNYNFYGTNTVWVPLKNGVVERTNFNEGMHPWERQFLPGVRQWGIDASLFKTVPITERVFLRFAIDSFNALNHPNNPNAIGGDGVLATRTSGSAARQTQLSLRVTW